VCGWRSVSAQAVKVLGLWECLLNIWSSEPVQKEKGRSTVSREGGTGFHLKAFGDVSL